MKRMVSELFEYCAFYLLIFPRNYEISENLMAIGIKDYNLNSKQTWAKVSITNIRLEGPKISNNDIAYILLNGKQHLRKCEYIKMCKFGSGSKDQRF